MNPLWIWSIAGDWNGRLSTGDGGEVLAMTAQSWNVPIFCLLYGGFSKSTGRKTDKFHLFRLATTGGCGMINFADPSLLNKH